MHAVLQCPWPPMMKLFQVHLGRLLERGPFQAGITGATPDDLALGAALQGAGTPPLPPEPHLTDLTL